MANTKIKAPPKSTGGEVLAMLGLTKSRQTSGYATKMSNLLNFLNITAGIRTGAEIVESDISIDEDGKVMTLEKVRSQYINVKMSAVSFLVKEESLLSSSLSAIYRELSECSKIISSKAKANTDEKKDKAQKKSDELRQKIAAQTELSELRQKIEGLKAEEQRKLEETDFPIQTMREKLELMAGCKIRVDLNTGSYTFPVPVGVPFYREVCNVLNLALPNQEAAEKPVIKRLFTLSPEILQAIKNAMSFASTDDLRPAMTCVALEINKGKMLVVATDAHRLFKSRQFEVSGPPGSYTYLLPARALGRLPKALKEDFVLYELKGGKMGICGLTVDLFTEAKFPDWKVVMPDYSDCGGVTFDRKTMISIVKQTMVYANKSTNQVNLYFNGQIEFAAQDVDFGFESTNRMAYNKKEMEDLLIGFNGRFLIESLSIFKADEITFQGSSPRKAAIFTDGFDVALVMPLMTNQ